MKFNLKTLSLGAALSCAMISGAFAMQDDFLSDRTTPYPATYGKITSYLNRDEVQTVNVVSQWGTFPRDAFIFKVEERKYQLTLDCAGLKDIFSYTQTTPITVKPDTDDGNHFSFFTADFPESITVSTFRIKILED